MNVTTGHSTYTHENGAQETVTLRRGPITPHGHAALKIEYSDGQIVDCYVNTGWLRDRLDDLGEPHPVIPGSITDEMVLRFWNAFNDVEDGLEDMTRMTIDKVRLGLRAALAEPPARPEGAEDIERLIRDAEIEGQGADNEALANYLAARLTDPTRKEA